MSTTDMAWVVLTDHIDDGPDDAVGIGRNVLQAHEAKGDTFELIDDDGILYYSGVGWGDFEEDAWAWGAYYAGSTLLRVNGKDVIG